MDTVSARTHLEEHRAKIIAQMEELGASESGDLRSDLDREESFADAAAATADRTQLLGLVDSLHKQLQSVDHALQRVDEDTYGICSECGQAIAPARLEARPEATLCVDCASTR
ncbi:MAG: TraR/DksA family transcriptional regulator [Acidimicrobiia bacterium]|nr:TraR/DksA family transcriptional regulator [Acidimicrobiia bacterium]